jgi:hypothetical protein
MNENVARPIAVAPEPPRATPGADVALLTETRLA